MIDRRGRPVEGNRSEQNPSQVQLVESMMGADAMRALRESFKEELRIYMRRVQRGEEKLQDRNMGEFFQEFDSNEASRELNKLLARQIEQSIHQSGAHQEDILKRLSELQNKVSQKHLYCKQF